MNIKSIIADIREILLIIAQGKICEKCQKYRKQTYRDGKWQCPLCDLKIVKE